MTLDEQKAVSGTLEELYSQRPNIGGLSEERILRCLKILRQVRGDRFLDVGCADGQITLALSEAVGAREAWGVDIAPEAVAAARSRGVNAFQANLDHQDLPLPPEHFDVVYCGEVIEHVFDPEHLLLEIRRVLKPGGLCLLTTPNLAGWPNRVALLLGFQPFPTSATPGHEGLGKLLFKGEEGQWGHIRVFTLRALKELLKLTGLELVKVEGCAVTIKNRHPLAPVVSFVDRLFARYPSAANRVILLLRKA